MHEIRDRSKPYDHDVGDYPVNEKVVRDAARNVFKSLPAEVILDMATRDFNMNHNRSCVCGWAFRAGIDRLKDAGFSHLADTLKQEHIGTTDDSYDHASDSKDGCVKLFNQASEEDWDTVYNGVTEDDVLPIIELEFVRRLDRAVQE